MRSVYRFNGFFVDVFGYNPESETFDYSVETPFSCKIRKAKKRYKSPDKRNEWICPCGTYIYIIDPWGQRQRLFIE